MSIIDTIADLMLNDDEDREKQADILKATWARCTAREQARIDEIMICVCGYSLTTLIEEDEPNPVREATERLEAWGDDR